MKRVVICMLDGLRADQARTLELPAIDRLRREGVWFGGHRSIFPSATRASSASVATGCYPAGHGLHGNMMALAQDSGFVVEDVGKPAFFDRLRAVRGFTLKRPTLAERVAGQGGAIVFSNVSPGAALAHDPDGFGHVYHRAVSRGPGRAQVPDPLVATLSLEGDRGVTARFCDEVLAERAPAVAVLWLGNPDDTQHDNPLGSPASLAAIRAADANLGLLIDAVDRLIAGGDDVLLLAGSDHGHETPTGVVPVEAELIAAGFKRDRDDRAIVVAPQGTGFLLYARDGEEARVAEIADWIEGRDWAGKVVRQGELGDVGHAADGGLALAVGMATDAEANAFGVPGRTMIATRFETTARSIGNGSHGGFGAYETAPFLLARGAGFSAGSTQKLPTSLVDIAPTALAHLELDASGADGRALQDFSHETSTGIGADHVHQPA
ncbi:MAG: alkaline phosphatase family protein [Beijerinckiaceae bacterium]